MSPLWVKKLTTIFIFGCFSFVTYTPFKWVYRFYNDQTGHSSSACASDVFPRVSPFGQLFGKVGKLLGPGSLFLQLLLHLLQLLIMFLLMLLQQLVVFVGNEGSCLRLLVIFGTNNPSGCSSCYRSTHLTNWSTGRCILAAGKWTRHQPGTSLWLVYKRHVRKPLAHWHLQNTCAHYFWLDMKKLDPPPLATFVLRSIQHVCNFKECQHSPVSPGSHNICVQLSQSNPFSILYPSPKWSHGGK